MAKKRTPKPPNGKSKEDESSETRIPSTTGEMRNLVESNLVRIVSSTTCSDRARIDAGRELSVLLKSKTSDGSDVIERVVQREMDRMDNMSEKDLAAYQVLLRSPKLDVEFEKMIEAEKRGMNYLPERGVEVKKLPKRGHRRMYGPEK